MIHNDFPAPGRPLALRVSSVTLPSDMDTPVGIYLKVRDLYPQSALLESSDYHTARNSVSYIGIDPVGGFTLTATHIVERWPGGLERRTALTPDTDVAGALAAYLGSYSPEGDTADCADTAGLLGYTAYDAVRHFEPVAMDKPDPAMADIPDMQYVLFRHVLRINHYHSTMTLFEFSLPGQEPGLSQVLDVLAGAPAPVYPFALKGSRTSTLTDRGYMDIVAACVAHAKRGDVFQIVPSRRFAQPYEGDDFQVYRALRSVNPSPYLFYFDMGGFRVFGSSPETHLRIKGRTAWIDPIAGTFRRTGDDARDHELARALLEDAKENAEHIMLVDLARNDLARSGGRVSIDFLRQIQYYSHVIHMVSRVRAELPRGADSVRLFAATFPAGTLSGAPKVRAMQIIDNLEPHTRKLYGGCIGFMGLGGDINQAITIRSFTSTGGVLYSQAGAGVVAASSPQSELNETNNKLGALARALEIAQQL